MQEKAFDAELVKRTMKARGVTQADMAKSMRLTSQSAFSNILRGKRRITAQEARLAYDYLGIPIRPSVRTVPIIGIANAGAWREAINMPLGELPIPIDAAGRDAFAIEVCGDSMNKLFADGSHVVVDPRDKELRDGKVYLIQNSEDEATLKAYFRSPPRFEPLSNNPDHKGWEIADHDFVVLGRVVLKVEPL